MTANALALGFTGLICFVVWSAGGVMGVAGLAAVGIVGALLAFALQRRSLR